MALADNLYAYYPFDEASGDALDAHSTHDLTETSGTIAAATGVMAGARDQEAGDTENFRAASDSTFDFGDTDFSLCGWVNAESLDRVRCIVGKWSVNSGRRSYALVYDSANDRFIFRVSDDGTGVFSVLADTLGSPSTSTWYFIYCEHDSANNHIGISVNAGTLDTTSHSAGVSTGKATSFGFGHTMTNLAADVWDGLTDEWGIWERCLDPAEVTELYNSDNGRDYAYIIGGAAAGSAFQQRRFGRKPHGLSGVRIY